MNVIGEEFRGYLVNDNSLLHDRYPGWSVKFIRLEGDEPAAPRFQTINSLMRSLMKITNVFRLYPSGEFQSIVIDFKNLSFRHTTSVQHQHTGPP